MECPHCNKSFKTYKSWHRHKTISHPEEIKDPSYKQTAYQQSPNHCVQCNDELPYSKRANRFCSTSCAGIFNNAKRNKDQVIGKLKATWRLKLGSLSCDKEPVIKTCPTCQTEFESKGASHTYCNPTCNLTKQGKVQYRKLCRFDLSPNTHSSLYNFDLIKTNGWYRPSNHKDGYNPDGVTWDHLYRVEEGYKNGISPSIMSHPANAEMVTWRDNRARQTSTISLEELLERISQWSSSEYS